MTPTLLGAVNAGLDIPENQIILTTRNGSQAPIKNLLENVYDYFSKVAIDGFQNGKRTDDPNKACRNSAAILIYDNFNGCQNDSCSFLTNHVLTKLKQIGVPVYVIGLGSSAVATSDTGRCIAQNTGAILPDGTVGYFPVTSPEELYLALSDITSFVNEAAKDFASATVSSVQAGGDQMVYLATFNATKNRSIWNGRVNGYKLDSTGQIQLGQRTIQDPNDPDNGLTLPAPSNDPASLLWNAARTSSTLREPAQPIRRRSSRPARRCRPGPTSTARTTRSRQSRPASTPAGSSSSRCPRVTRIR